MEIKYILYLGDLHFKINNNKETDIVIKESLEFLDRLVKSTDKKVLCVLGGDLLHEHEKIFIKPMNKMINFIEKLKNICGEIIILVGNHDYENNRQFFTDNHWMNTLKKWPDVIIVDKVFEKYNMVFMPYVPPGMFVTGLNQNNSDWKKCKYIFAHQEFRGCDVGLHKSDVGDIWDKSWPLVISGHIHKPQKLGENIIYPGSVIQHNYGESNNYTGLFVIDVENNTYEKIHINLPEYKTIKISINEKDELEKFNKFLTEIKVQELEKLRIEVNCESSIVNSIKKTSNFKNIPPNMKIVFKVKLPEKPKNKCNNHKEFLKILCEKISIDDQKIIDKILNQSKISFDDFI